MAEMTLSRFSDLDLARECMARLDDCDLEVKVTPQAIGTWKRRGGQPITLTEPAGLQLPGGDRAAIIETDAGPIEAMPGDTGRVLIVAWRPTNTPPRIDRNAAQELIDSIEAYNRAVEYLEQYGSGMLGTDMWTGEAALMEVVSAQFRVKAAFKAATGWDPVYHPAGEDPNATPPSWSIE